MDAPEQQTAPRRRAGTRWAAVGGLGAVAALSAVLLTGPWGAEDTGSPAPTATAPAAPRASSSHRRSRSPAT